MHGDRSSLSEPDIEIAREALRQYASVAGQGLAALMSGWEHRREAVAQINERLERRVVNEMFVYQISFVEYRDPRPPA